MEYDPDEEWPEPPVRRRPEPEPIPVPPRPKPKPKPEPEENTADLAAEVTAEIQETMSLSSGAYQYPPASLLVEGDGSIGADALGASGVRIAPIPDKISMVGIEVPNKLVSPVYIHDVIDSAAFRNHDSKVAFALGKDIGGNCIVGNICWAVGLAAIAASFLVKQVPAA